MCNTVNNTHFIMSESKSITTTTNSEVMNTVEVEKVVSTIDELHDIFVDCNVMPKYTDSKNYVGTTSKFSVNLKKSKYNVFMKSSDYELILDKIGDRDGITYNGDTNNSKVRPWYVEVTNTTVLRDILKIISTVTGNAIK